MFYCASCARLNHWPHGWPLPQSRGPCEVCRSVCLCTDAPTRWLRTASPHTTPTLAGKDVERG